MRLCVERPKEALEEVLFFRREREPLAGSENAERVFRWITLDPLFFVKSEARKLCLFFFVLSVRYLRARPALPHNERVEFMIFGELSIAKPKFLLNDVRRESGNRVVYEKVPTVKAKRPRGTILNRVAVTPRRSTCT